ncbi:MAG: hypothetical protein F4Y03_07285 [Alphaproteobacteria bacterium]|nr:hypothetical protein [Alphaproteobacteria bacterium]MYE01072.1 hypothetical protein [Alphaproteobacteria bacterium]
MTMRAAASAVVLAVLCFGFALPGVADRYGSMAEDLLFRQRPPGEPLLTLVKVLFVIVQASLLGLVLWAWHRGNRRSAVAFGAVFAALAGLWWFGLGYLEAAFVEGLAPPVWDRWQG